MNACKFVCPCYYNLHSCVSHYLPRHSTWLTKRFSREKQYKPRSGFWILCNGFLLDFDFMQSVFVTLCSVCKDGMERGEKNRHGLAVI